MGNNIFSRLFDHCVCLLIEHPWGEATFMICFFVPCLLAVLPIFLIPLGIKTATLLMASTGAMIVAILSPVNAVLLLHFFHYLGLKKVDQV